MNPNQQKIVEFAKNVRAWQTLVSSVYLKWAKIQVAARTLPLDAKVKEELIGSLSEVKDRLEDMDAYIDTAVENLIP